MKVLIVEDREALVKEYLRIFAKVIGDAEIDFTSVNSIQDTLPALAEEDWDVILVDHDLGPPGMYPEGASEEDGVKVPNGAELTRFRRSIEDATDDMSPSFILGIPNSHALGYRLVEAGANASLLKLKIPEIGQLLRNKYKEKQAQ